MSAAPALIGRFLADQGRRPINLVLLTIVPVIFVVLSSSALADFARALGVGAETDSLSSVTASWAAAFLAGVSGFFLVHDSREADRRLAGSGMAPTAITLSRLATGLLLALVASTAALVALALQADIADPIRATTGTFMSATIYLAIGVAVGSLVRSDVNGSLVVIFIWMLDVFLGPAMAGGDMVVTRVFPSHFVTLVTLDAATTHGGPISDLGWALLWAAGSLVAAALLFARTTSVVRPSGSRAGQVSWRSGGNVAAGFRYGLIEYRRNVAMWAMLVVLPVIFITLSFYVTPDTLAPIEVVEDGTATIVLVSMSDIHGALMVPITVGFLAGLAGLFVVQGSLQADARLVLAGFRPREVFQSRMGVIAAAAMLVSAVSLAVAAIDFWPRSWFWFAVSNALVALTYGLLGVLVGVLFGRLGGLYVMFLVPFIDVGLAQNVMFSAAPPEWGVLLPARGAVHVFKDGAFTSNMDVLTDLALALVWLAGLAAVTAVLFRRITAPRRI